MHLGAIHVPQEQFTAQSIHAQIIAGDADARNLLSKRMEFANKRMKKSVKSGDMRGGFDTLQFPPPENACVLGGD